MAYLLVTLNHFKVVQAWANRAGAEVTLDVKTFELEVKAQHRFYKLFPQFFSVHGGQFGHSKALTDNSDGFIGWLPYRPVSWELATEKLVFKKFLVTAGEPTPRSWVDDEPVPMHFLLKRSRGSFGYDLSGPFRAGDKGSAPPLTNRANTSRIFAEQFIAGQNLKVWFWGGEAFHAHLHAYPSVQGDGSSSLAELIESRLSPWQRTLDDSPDMLAIRAALAFQHVALEQVLTQGHTVWLDYRYGRRYERDPTTAREDNALTRLSPEMRAQILRVGHKLAQELDASLKAPVLFSLDGVVDEQQQIWWLEMNSNPVMPPAGYPLVFRSLFGSPLPDDLPTLRKPTDVVPSAAAQPAIQSSDLKSLFASMALPA